MIKKEYGTQVAELKWCTNGALVDRCLEVYRTKKGVKALLWNSGCKGWREEPHHPIWSSMIWHPMNEEGLDNTQKRLIAYCQGRHNIPENTKLEEPFHKYGTWD